MAPPARHGDTRQRARAALEQTAAGVDQLEAWWFAALEARDRSGAQACCRNPGNVDADVDADAPAQGNGVLADRPPWSTVAERPMPRRSVPVAGAGNEVLRHRHEGGIGRVERDVDPPDRWAPE